MGKEQLNILWAYSWDEGGESIPYNSPYWLKNTDTFITVAGTCTHFAIQRILPLLWKPASIVFFNSFDECEDAFRQSRGGVTMPLAEPMADRRLQEYFPPDFGVGIQLGWPGSPDYAEHRLVYGFALGAGNVDSATTKNPPIYFAKKPETEDIKTIACLKELEHFLGDTPDKNTIAIILADSNIHAAHLVQSGQADACITNQTGVDTNGLKIIQQTGYNNMHFAFIGRWIEEIHDSWRSLRQEYNWLTYVPFPLSNMHYQRFIERGWNKKENWSEEWWAWKQQHPERSYPTYWHTREWIEALKPVTGITFWEAEACAKHFGMRLPTLEEFQTLAFNAQSHHPIHSPGFISESSHRLNIDKTHPLIGNVAKWCIGPNGVVMLCGGSSWDYDARWNTTIFMPPGNCDNNTGIFLVSGSLNSPDIRTEEREWTIGKNIRRPTAPFRQEWNKSSEKAREKNGEFKIFLWENSHEFDLKKLEALPQHEQTGTFQCVCNWAEFCKVRGVLLQDILMSIGWQWDAEKTYLYCESYPWKDGKTYTTCERLDRLLNPDAPTMLITHLQTSHDQKLEPLSDELGWPIRIWSNWINGYKQVKALQHMRLQDTFQAGKWESKAGYPEDGTPQPGTRTIIGRTSQRIHSPGWIIGTTQTIRID